MRGCGRRAKHLQLLSEADDYLPSRLAACRSQVSRTFRIVGGKLTEIIDLMFLKCVTTVWTETCSTIQCTGYYICLHFSLISPFSVALWNHRRQTRCKVLALLVFKPCRLKSHNYRPRSTVNALSGILIVTRRTACWSKFLQAFLLKCSKSQLSIGEIQLCEAPPTFNGPAPKRICRYNRHSGSKTTLRQGNREQHREY